MGSGEMKLTAFLVFLAFLLLVGIGSCSYQEHVVLPQKMAEKNFCWNVNTRAYAPCANFAK